MSTAKRCRHCGTLIEWVQLADQTVCAVDRGAVEFLRVNDDAPMQGVTEHGELVQGSPTFKASGVRVRRVHACRSAA